MLSVEGVSLSIRGYRILDNVSFTVGEGSITSIIGPNGAGKTSLLNVVSGFYRPQKGRVYYMGRDITMLPARERVKLGIARTFQHSELFKSMTVLDNVMAGLVPFSGASIIESMMMVFRARRELVEARERAEEVIDFLELHRYRWMRVGSLPPGIQKKVDLARALVSRPRLILMDEPMSGLSREEREDIAAVILELNRVLRTTLVLVEHDMEAVMDLSDKVVAMDYGRVVAVGAPGEVASNEAVLRAYMG